MLNWLMNHVFDREGYRQFKEESRRLDENVHKLADLDKRIAEVFTPEEWAATRERCERRLREVG